MHAGPRWRVRCVAATGRAFTKDHAEAALLEISAELESDKQLRAGISCVATGVQEGSSEAPEHSGHVDTSQLFQSDVDRGASVTRDTSVDLSWLFAMSSSSASVVANSMLVFLFRISGFPSARSAEHLADIFKKNPKQIVAVKCHAMGKCKSDPLLPWHLFNLLRRVREQRGRTRPLFGVRERGTAVFLP